MHSSFSLTTENDIMFHNVSRETFKTVSINNRLQSDSVPVFLLCADMFSESQ